MHNIDFVRFAFKDLKTVGMLFPSSPLLAKTVVSNILSSKVEGRRILEIGCGNGALTWEILKSLDKRDRLIIVEINEQFCQSIRMRIDRDWTHLASTVEVVNANVFEMAFEESFDFVICSLPLYNFKSSLVNKFLSNIFNVLKPGGILSRYEYFAIRGLAKHISSANKSRISEIEWLLEQYQPKLINTQRVIANLPPADVFHYMN